jgi:F-type H+-transporting ATPase subunit gamma
MASLRIVRRRLRSIQSTKQIMRAMQLVSASKFKRSQDRLLEVRGLMEFLDGLLQRVLAAIPDLDHPTTRSGWSPHPTGVGGWWDHPLCTKREEAADALVIFTSDAGLCGAYNTNLIQLAEAELRRDTLHPAQCISIGKKGHRHFTKRGHEVVESHIDLAGRPNLRQAREIGQSLMKRFLLGEVSSIKLLYPRFISSMTNRPVVETWLPVRLAPSPSAQARKSPGDEYIFEPTPKRVFEDLLPRWALAKFQLVMLEAFTSEHSARMIAMKNATDNAAELIDELTMQRNKIRQASITKEISEIVGTAEALR